MNKEDVEKVLDKIRPMLQADGGDIKLISVKNNVVKVKLTGACMGCPMATLTLRNSVEATLKKELPELERVEAL